MSHFHCCVFVPTNVAENPETLDAYLNHILAPFDESLKMPEYDRPCYCVGSVAQNAADEQAAAECGTISDLRKSFANLVLPDGRTVCDMQIRHEKLTFQAALTPEEVKESKRLDAELASLWSDHLVPLQTARRKCYEAHPMKDKPDPTCGFDDNGKRYVDGSGCAGTGIIRVTYNPEAKWDYWVIGGRWNGWLAPPEAQPEKDPDNWETCFVCRGTGLRDDKLGTQARALNPAYTCNGCNGTGTTLMWPSQQKNTGYNVVAPSYIESLGIIDAEEGCPTPFAFITLDGAWHQSADMGWWGVTANEVDVAKWKQEWRSALAGISDDFNGVRVVVVDLHI